MTENMMIPSDLDFEHVDDITFTTGIQEAGRALANKYIVRFPYLYVKTYQNNTYRLPLAVKADYFDKLDDNLSPLKQIRLLLERENPGKKKQVDQELTVSLLAIADQFAQTVTDVQMASLGKYKPSGSESAKSE